MPDPTSKAEAKYQCCDDLEENFHVAANRIAEAATSGRLSSDEQLQIYGLYKQSTSGPCLTFRPPFYDTKGRSKWAAWQRLGDMPSNIAKYQYVEYTKKILPQPESSGEVKEGSLGPVMSRFADAAESDDMQTLPNLQARARDGNLEGLQCLLEKAEDVDSVDAEGCSALHWAVDRNQIQVVKYLLSRGADPNLQDQEGQSVLHYAALGGHKQVIELLLEAGADLSLRDSDEKTAYELASSDTAEVFKSTQNQTDESKVA